MKRLWEHSYIIKVRNKPPIFYKDSLYRFSKYKILVSPFRGSLEGRGDIMAYVRDIWRFKDSIEYEFKFLGRYGAKGEKRAERAKPTPEQMARQNQLNREKKVRRLIKANFTEKDYWLTLKYPKGERPDIETVKKDMARFLGRLRRMYKKVGEEVKFIYRLEIGSRGGAHVHIILNRAQGLATDLAAQEAWTYGRVNYQHLHETGGYADLAAYLVKPPSVEAQRHIDQLPPEERKEVIKYSPSRNLIRPEPERKEYTHSTMRRLIDEGPTASEGYYIDYDSVKQGVNFYTGMSYLHYTECRIEPPKRGRPEGPRKERNPFENC